MESKVEWMPLGARLILRRVQEYKGGIIIPDSSKSASMMCEVVAVGGRCDAEYAVGELLLIGRYSGFDVPVMNKQYADCIIVNEADILCFASKERNNG